MSIGLGFGTGAEAELPNLSCKTCVFHKPRAPPSVQILQGLPEAGGRAEVTPDRTRNNCRQKEQRPSERLGRRYSLMPYSLILY
ncbi:hypothetical protein NITMOv2_3751 [Nitrospira moscoviensis]|uniref:Uncharacterized protein n=1 Tax=Nitrospira moscoviensis TaxID=42253 RepID=A0A0K2GHN3_NITMO|nr:hypothetical protein NITMOv2_3751 [Nitrospira moscoviensis]